MTQTAKIRAGRAFVTDALLQATIEAGGAETLLNPPATAGGTDKLRECSICDEMKPAAGFRQVLGRITTEACGQCCDRRDEADSSQQTAASRTEITREAVAEFCLRLATKRFERQARPLPQAVLTISAPNLSGKEKSALAKSPQEYPTKLQPLPPPIAPIPGKTVPLKGD